MIRNELNFLFGDEKRSRSLRKRRQRTCTLSLDDYSVEGEPNEEFLAVLTRAIEDQVERLAKRRVKLALKPQEVVYLSQQLHKELDPVYSSTGIIQRWIIKSTDSTLLKLSSLMHRIQHVKLHSGRQIPFNLHVFAGLSVLEIVGVDISCIQGLECFKDQLQMLIVDQSPMKTTETILKTQFTRLTSVKIRHCELEQMDSSLELVPNVKQIDFSNNRLKRIQNLEKCSSIESLNLGFNRISSLNDINQVLGNIKSLNLRYNNISSIQGLDKLYSLQSLDLSHNRLSDLGELGALTAFPELIQVALSGNPLAYVPDYRRQVLFLFSDRIELDRVPWTTAELYSISQRKSVGETTFNSHEPSSQRTLGYPKLSSTRTVQAKVVDITDPDREYPVPGTTRSREQSPERIVCSSSRSVGRRQSAVTIVDDEDPPEGWITVEAFHDRNADDKDALVNNIDTGGERRRIRIEGYSIYEVNNEELDEEIGFDLHFLESLATSEPNILKLDLRGNHTLGYRFKNVIAMGELIGQLQEIMSRVFGTSMISFRCLDCKSLIHRVSHDALTVLDCPICTSKNIRPMQRHEMRHLFEDKGITTEYLRRVDTIESIPLHFQRLGFQLDDRTPSNASLATEESILIAPQGLVTTTVMETNDSDDDRATEAATALQI